MGDSNRIEEFAYNFYTEKTGCPSLRTILAYQDSSETNNVIPPILTLTDAERVERSYATLKIQDPVTKKTTTLGSAFFPPELYFELHFKYYGAPAKSSPSECSAVEKVPQDVKKFFEVYESMKGEGIDIVLRCPGRNNNLDMLMNIAKPKEFIPSKEYLEEMMVLPNKPIIVDLIHDQNIAKFKEKAIERTKKKISSDAHEKLQILSGNLEVYDKEGYPILDENGNNQRETYEHPIFRIETPAKPYLIRYLIPYNETNLPSLQQLLANKFVTYLSKMHAQVPAIQEEMKERKLNEKEYERIKRNTILNLRKEVEESEKITEEIEKMSNAKKQNRKGSGLKALLF